jgi:cellulose synthase operon protein C
MRSETRDSAPQLSIVNYQLSIVRRLFTVHCSLLTLLLLPLVLHAQPIDYDPRRPAALHDCDDHRYRGQDAKAYECYTALLSSSIDLVVLAESAWATGDLKRANDYFRRAAQFDATASLARARWGRLFIQTHQYAEAADAFREVINKDPTDPQALLGLAEVYAAQYEGPARPIVDQLLEAHPDLIGAHILSARMALEEGNIELAEKVTGALPALLSRANRPPLEAESLRAALDLTRDDNAKSPAIKRALDYNPHYGSIYADLAHVETMRRRYREASALLKRAIEIAPGLWSAHSELGINLLRLNDVAAAQRELETAYAGDPYSAITVNTLRLLEKRDQYKDIVSPLGAREKEPAFIARLEKQNADAMSPYVLKLGNDALKTFSQRYQFQLRQPVTVEFYPDHDDFAVRVGGLPGIGLLGVTFGYVVAMDSPAGRSTGDFHWGSTMWHELAHVFTLELTDHRVPRWLSEGLSVFEEWRTGPTPGIVVTPDVLEAMNAKQLLPITDLDSGFIRPKYRNQVQVSYVQAGLVCAFIDEQWGFDRLLAFLKAFSRDTTIADALQATLKISPEEFDKRFSEYVVKGYGGAAARLDDWKAAAQNAHAALAKKNWAEALAAARAANDIYPQYSGSGSLYIVAAQSLDALKQRDEAIRMLQTYRKSGGWDPDALAMLAKWLDEAQRKRESIEVLDALNYVNPLEPGHHATLGDDLLAANRPQEALTEFQTLLALKPHDVASAKFGLARALRATGDAPAGKRALLDALEIAPHYKPAQALLLQITEEPSP